MLGLDPNDESIQEMLNHYRLLFASEPNVNGRQPSIIKAIQDYNGRGQEAEKTAKYIRRIEEGSEPNPQARQIRKGDTRTTCLKELSHSPVLR